MDVDGGCVLGLWWVEVGVRPLQAVDDPFLSGRWPGYDRGRVKALAVADGRAYLGADKVLVYDVTGPGEPVLLGTHTLANNDTFQGLAVYRGYVYASSALAGLTVLDSSDPARLAAVAGYPDFGAAGGMAVAGDRLFLATGTGLTICALTDPASPVWLGEYATAGTARHVAVAGDTAWVVAEGDGLVGIDVTDPTHPQRLGTCALPGSGAAVAAAGGYAYVANGGAGFSVVDIREPAAPRLVGRALVTLDARAVALRDRFAYVAAGAAGLQVLRVSDPTNPSPVEALPLNGSTAAVVGAGDHLYVADRGLQVLDSREPSSPRPAWWTASDTTAQVAVAGDYAYLADGAAGLQIVRVTDPRRMHRVGGFVCGDVVAGLAAVPPYVFLAGGKAGLIALEVRDPTQPRQVGGLSSYVVDVALAGGYAFCAAGKAGLFTVDVRAPSEPRLLGSCAVSGGANRLVLTPEYAFTVGGAYGLRAIDIRDPSRPRQVGSFDPAEAKATDMASAVAVAGRYVYVLYGNLGIHVVDVRDPASMQSVGFFSTGLWSGGLIVAGPQAFVLGDRLQVLNLADPTRPELFAGLKGIGTGVGGCLVGNRLFVAAADLGLTAIDLPAWRPVFQPRVTVEERGCRVSFEAASGQAVRLQRSRDLLQWEDWQQVVATGQGEEVWDDEAPTGSRRFYRALSAVE